MNIPAPTAGMRNSYGLTGGRFILNRPSWQQAVRDEIARPDQPYDPRNDHYRTIYAQMMTHGPYQKATGAVAVGPVMRLSQGISNGVIKTIFDVPANGALHAAVCAESVFADVACVQVYYPLVAGHTPTFTQDQIDNPPLIVADAPPVILAGLLRNQSLAMNTLQTPKRTICFEIAAGETALLPIPAGSQTVRVGVDPTVGVAKSYQRLLDVSTEIGFPINTEVPLFPDVSFIHISSTASANFAVAFGLGI